MPLDGLLGADLLERLLGGFLLRGLLRGPNPHTGLVAVDHGCRREPAVVRRSLDFQNRVAHLPTHRGKLLLELGLEVDVRRRRVLDPAGKRLDDRLLDVLEAVLEEESRERRFQQRGKDVAIP
jgi:hypothetical protein